MRTRWMPRIVLPCLAIVSGPAFTPRGQSILGQEPASIGSRVQSFVDRQELAGAVMLVADRNRILAVEAVG